MALHPHEFIRRWLHHVLPKGLTRIRHYGYLGSAARKTRLRIRAMLGEIGEPVPKLPEPIPFTCQCCGGVLTFLREIAPFRILRAPPSKHPLPQRPQRPQA
jgi:Putative transposase